MNQDNNQFNQNNNVNQQPINQMHIGQPTYSSYSYNDGNNNNPNYGQAYNNPLNTSYQPIKPKKNNAIIIIAIILAVIIGIIALFVSLFSKITNGSKKMICESSKGNITIMYNENELIGYVASGMSYDLDDQKEYAKKVGVNAYLLEFNEWFKSNTSGSCTIDGEEVENNLSSENETSNESEDKNNYENTTVVGDDKNGYINIPKNWYRFYDVDGNTSLQYSYANIYIVSLNYLEANGYSAKDYASNYMYNKKNSGEVTGVTGATVKIGKNKEYTAYQVYMYYPSDNTYLVTYWFEAEDGKIHYIALEGPEELSGVKITDYLYIPESFSLKK